MFTVFSRRLYFICDKIPVRHLRNRRFDRPGANPGLDNRLGAFKEDGIKIQDDDVEEFMEQSDSNFYNVGEAYNAHLNETLMGKHKIKLQIVKEKYFKENMPNLLTWSEKEQIRHLAATQPDEWTPQRIAESFPVTEQVAKKLLKYPWKPTTEERIARHDTSAMRNWRELKEGTLDIPEDLRTHFLKFSERKIPPLNKKSIKVDVSQEKIGEFEQIVQKCASNEENNRTSDKFEHSELNSNEESKPTRKDWKKVTLDELASKIKTRLDKGKDVNVPDRMIMDSINTVPSNTVNTNEVNKEIELFNEKKDEKSITNYKKEDTEVVPGPSYPERIRIPKKAYQRGATYKVDDCFYDHDGRFLYRVIGMTDSH
ncbi:neugrin [Pararge aegeria]|uniref:neugrin n=1 Tax=Pararge aegeria TaxID=116150 RepID=UPI0019CFC5A1|nr:neugrin [Pararge aegeria]